MQGYLKISSVHLLDTLKYPFIPVGKDDFKKVEISKGAVVDENDPLAQNQIMHSRILKGNWRKNPLYGVNPEVPTSTSFYFRLTSGILYYTDSSMDFNVLGAMSIKDVHSASNVNSLLMN